MAAPNGVPTTEEVRDLIEAAFRDIRLGSGVSLHQTEVLDEYGGEAEQAAARARDELDDWRKVAVDPELKAVHGIGGPSFMDAEGLRFYLPAYMTLALEEPGTDAIESVLFQLTHLSDYSRVRLAILNAAQREAVLAFLLWLRATDGGYWEPLLTKAIDEYWSRDHKSAGGC